jgi:uncharacterized protein YlxP (DUF503 family)
MRRNLQAANVSIHTYPPHTYNQTELRGQPGKSVPMTRAGSIPFRTTDVWGVVAKHTKILEFPSNKNKLQPLPGESVPILRAPNQMYSAHTLAQTMEREGLKHVKVAVVDPYERRAIIRDIHRRLQKKYAAHYASALNTRNVGVIHSMIESSSSIMAAKGSIPTDEIARHLARVPQVAINAPAAIPSALVASSTAMPAAIPSALVASSSSSSSSTQEQSSPPGSPSQSIAPSMEVAPSTAIGPSVAPSIFNIPENPISGLNTDPKLEEKSTDIEFETVTKPYALNSNQKKTVVKFSKQKFAVSESLIDKLLENFSISPTKVTDRYPNMSRKLAQMRYLIDISPDFRNQILVKKYLSSDILKNLIVQTESGRQDGEGRQVENGKKKRAALRSGMFGATHKKMVHQPTRSYRNQLI